MGHAQRIAAAEGEEDRLTEKTFELVSESERKQVAELDRRWAVVQAGERTHSNDQVIRWLETWGKADYRP